MRKRAEPWRIRHLLDPNTRQPCRNPNRTPENHQILRKQPRILLEERGISGLGEREIARFRAVIEVDRLGAEGLKIIERGRERGTSGFRYRDRKLGFYRGSEEKQSRSVLHLIESLRRDLY